MNLKNQRVRFQGGRGPTGIIESETPDDEGFVEVYWGHHDGSRVVDRVLFSELEPAPPSGPEAA